MDESDIVQERESSGIQGRPGEGTIVHRGDALTAFGRYMLERQIGSGGMAEIWKARIQGPSGFEKSVAIKKVLPQFTSDPEFLDMFIAEAKLVATLSHPNIVQVLDFGKVGERDYFISMEYVAGANLASLSRRLADRGQRLPVEVSLYIAWEAVKALGYAHAHVLPDGTAAELVHRDVSPQNILVSFAGDVKVTDFGIAKVASAMSHTAEGHVRGKLSYMSPEQAKARPVDRRSDIFSLGIVLYELLSARRLFKAPSPTDQFALLMNYGGLTDEQLKAIPGSVGEFLQQTMRPSPDERFQSCAEMEEALAEVLGPQAMVHAKRVLASVMETAFPDERKLESTGIVVSERPSTGSQSLPLLKGSEDAPTTAQDSKSLALATRTQDSASLAVPVPAVSRAQTAPATRRPLGPFLIAGGVAMGLVFAAFFAGGALRRATENTATPTPVVAALPSPAISAAPSVAPTATSVAPTSTVRPTSTRPVVVPTAVPVRTGTLTVNARPWAQVWVDGKLVAKETPWRGTLTAGKHTVKLVNPPARYSVETVVDVPAGGTRGLVGDVKAGTLRAESP